MKNTQPVSCQVAGIYRAQKCLVDDAARGQGWPKVRKGARSTIFQQAAGDIQDSFIRQAVASDKQIYQRL